MLLLTHKRACTHSHTHTHSEAFIHLINLCVLSFIVLHSFGGLFLSLTILLFRKAGFLLLSLIAKNYSEHEHCGWMAAAEGTLVGQTSTSGYLQVVQDLNTAI